MGVKGKSGRKNRGMSLEYKHISIWVSATDWDRLNYLADGENKTVSRFIVDKILAKDSAPMGKIGDYERKCKSLCVKKDEHELIKERAKKYHCSVTNYILGVALQ